MPKNTKRFKQDPAAAIGSFSKNLLGLKFMQKAKQQFEKMIEEKNDPSLDTSLCKKMKEKQQFVINPSYQFCERLRFGRLSFKGMNEDIEAIMAENQPEKDTSTTSTKRGRPPASPDSSDNEIDNLESEEERETQDELNWKD